MGIMRVAKNSNYTVMNRTALNDTRLSWKAKGIIAYMLSMPDDWVFYFDELVKHSTDGKASFRAGFDELKKCGYVERKACRRGQRISHWETIVHEVPQDNSLLTDFQEVEKQEVENQEVGFQEVENRTLLSTDNNQVLNLPNTDRELNTDNNKQSVVGPFAKVTQFYESNMGPLTPFIGQELGYLADEYGTDLVLESLKVSLENNKRNIKYPKGILKNWNNENIKSLHDLEMKRRRGENNAINQSNAKTKIGDVELGF
ncbi:DnaD domain-containing protein [Viridibacillus arvi]|uniref:DnaD domain-containing protein n=1 Tax=Viridibacillus arvi TaxID=263475 RepID=UPI003D03170E